MENMRSLVHRLFTVLHLEEFQKRRERHLMAKIDHLKEQLQPLEQVCVCGGGGSHASL